MKVNKIVIALNEKIFLEFCKTLDIKNIKTNEDIIIGEKNRENSEGEEESLIIVHGKDIQKTVDFVKSTFIYIEKIILANSANILSNGELQKGDVIIPNTFLGNNGKTIFVENMIGEDYDLNNFGLALNGMCVENNTSNKEVVDEFLADVTSENIFLYLQLLQSEELLEKTIVTLQIGEENYTNLIAVSDMSL
ncbi:hypothetical protein LR004_01770 [Candidatus Gracilibacteria bacterium]|nr:hypothetical protein [Candidatus Gracilibacteria bacterium]